MKKTAIVFLIAALFVITVDVNAQITFDEASQKQIVMTNMAAMPMTFTENRGQWNEKALFKTDAGGATFWFCSDEINYVFTRDTDELLEDDNLMRRQESLPDASRFDQPRYKKESLVIRAQLIGANPDAEIIGENRLSHNCNYFIGNEPSKWYTDVPNYSSITYKDIYPGIDLKYHGNGQGMKYDFIVNPGADISQIQIRYEGADDLTITPNGDLEATTLFGTIHENIPSVYQELGSSKREVAGRYVIRVPGVIGFEVDDYNPSLILVIDPELIYSTYLGGNNGDRGYSIALDDSGCAYVTGVTNSSDFPTVIPYQMYQGSYDAFVTKLSASGDSLVYSTYLGGSSFDDGCGIAVDGSGNAYVTGWTLSTDFPTENPYQTDQGDRDAFVIKLSASGDSLVYSTYLGGSSFDDGYGIAVDGSGCAYVTGRTSSSDFPTVDPYQTDQGNWDSFVTKLSASGNSLVYSTYLGGSSADCGYGIAVDGSGCAYVTGRTWSSDFPTVNPYDGNHSGTFCDAFVTKFSASGSSLVYSTYLGGNDWDDVFGIAIDGNDCAYVTGFTGSNDFPTVNPYQMDQGGSDAFVTKFSASGNSLVFSTYLGGNGDEGPFYYGHGIAVDGSGSAYVTGSTCSSNFPTVNPYQTNQGDEDAFVAKFDITMFYEYLPGDVNMAIGLWPPAVIGNDVTYLVNYFSGSTAAQPCLLGLLWASADANGDCRVIGSDVVRMVNYFRGAGDIEYCTDYPPAWPTSGDLPPSAPSGWPNCE